MSLREMPEDDVQRAIEEGPSRYAAFGMRLRTIITASSRYIAYSSDVGEAFRPLTNPIVVRGAYAVSWAYILGDCGYAGWLAHKQRAENKNLLTTAVDKVLTPAQKVELRKRQLDAEKTSPIQWNPLEASETTHVGLVVARRAVFQSLASMALPAFTIHSIVRYSAPLFAKSSNVRVRGAGPTIAGLAAVPALPFLFDHPVEHVVDTAFDWIELRLAEAKVKAEEVTEKKTNARPSLSKSDTVAGGVSVKDVKPTNVALSAAAIVGVGVDIVHVPRIYALIARHATRLHKTMTKQSGSITAAASAALSQQRPLDKFNEHHTLASEHLARRVMHSSEYSKWLTIKREANDFVQASSDSPPSSPVLKLASTWAVKEAAFKAISDIPHPRLLTWQDAFLTTADNSRKPLFSYTEQLLLDWKDAKLQADRPPPIHVSISHDGDYVTAFAVAGS